MNGISGFFFNGKHSWDDFGIVMKSKDRPILPEPKVVVEEITCMDGDYDFTDANPDGRTKYKPRIMDIECSFKKQDMKYIRIRAHEIANWLACGEQQLIFDDETAVFYMARVNNKLDFTTEIARIGRFTIQFKCRPFGFSRIKSNQQLQFGQGLMLGYGYRLDMVPTVFNVTGATVLNIYNPGTWVKPIIRINGSCSLISFSANGKTLSYGSISNGQVDIDCYKTEAYKNGVSNSANNAMNNVSGDFLEFINGNNSLQISGTNLNCTVTLIFNYLYL